MMISLIVVDKKILSGEAMGDSLTAIPMRATGHTLNEETSTLQYSERPAETNFVGVFHFEQSKMVSVRNLETSRGLLYFKSVNSKIKK